MNLTINASNLVTKHYLEISDQGVAFCETAITGGVRHFAFAQIDAVLRGQNSVLSFQVGQDTYRIPIRQDNPTHRAAVARLVSEVRRTVRRSGGN